MHAALARVTVVVPVGPGDRLSPVLQAQLAGLPREAGLHLVYARLADAGRLRVISDTDDGPRVECMVAAPGRAGQQNAGAAASGRDWLWFLHADSRLASATLPALAALVQRDEPALGYFDLRFLDDGPMLMRLNASGAWLRSHWFGLPFGDQGLALPRATFVSLGGFDTALSRGEDHDLVWRARRARVPLRALHAPLFTSARKYAEHGWWATTTAHLRESWQQARRFSRTESTR
ncbi:MAG: glycosyl transferase family 2 [Lysobacter sp.]